MTSLAYITTPIYYVNASPHLGSAYTTWACDTWARFQRLCKKNVFFLTGTDEHGQKVEKAACDVHMDPQAFVDYISETFRDLTSLMNVTCTDFIRTTEARHIKAVQALWGRLQDNGFIELGYYEGWYDVRNEAFLSETDMIGGQPPEGAVWVREPSYFFKLSHFQKPLLDFYTAHPQFIQPESRRNEVLRFVEGGLTDLSISRTSFTWGIPVPSDPSHVMYVWLDALTNYISALGYPNLTENFQSLWPQAIHVVGKDILRFHAVYWPAFLMAAGLPLPKTIWAHGWWTRDGQKMSKSLGNTIDPFHLIEQYGADEVRYFLLREIPFGQDGDFSSSAFFQRLNSDLANTYGNLVQRVFMFIYKNLDGYIPALSLPLENDDLKLYEAPLMHLSSLQKHMDDFAFHRYLEELWTILHQANQYVDTHKPWTLKNTDPKRLHQILHVLVHVIRDIAVLSAPFLPKTSSMILRALEINTEDLSLDILQTPLIKNILLEEPKPLFRKWDSSMVINV